jgi:hypothetical protein
MFGLVIGFIKHLQIVTTSNYSAAANSHYAIHYSTHLSLLSPLCVRRFSGNGFNNVLCFRAHVRRLATVPQQSTRLNSVGQVIWSWSGLNRKHRAQVGVGGVVSRVSL